VPISGLVVTFDDHVELYPDSIKALHRAPQVELGEIRGCKCAVVIESQSQQHDRELWQWVHDLPGVSRIDVAMVGFE